MSAKALFEAGHELADYKTWRVTTGSATATGARLLLLTMPGSHAGCRVWTGRVRRTHVSCCCHFYSFSCSDDPGSSFFSGSPSAKSYVVKWIGRVVLIQQKRAINASKINTINIKYQGSRSWNMYMIMDLRMPSLDKNIIYIHVTQMWHMIVNLQH